MALAFCQPSLSARYAMRLHAHAAAGLLPACTAFNPTISSKNRSKKPLGKQCSSPADYEGIWCAMADLACLHQGQGSDRQDEHPLFDIILCLQAITALLPCCFNVPLMLQHGAIGHVTDRPCLSAPRAANSWQDSTLCTMLSFACRL